MWECPKCHESIEGTFDTCWNCGTSRDGTEDPHFESQKDATMEGSERTSRDIPAGMVLVTTPSLESHQVKRYLGVVCAEAIVGANVIRDIFAGITDIVGGRSFAYESALAGARQMAIAEMAHRAKDLGGNAVLSIDVDYETIRGSMLMVTCSGTAVEVDGPQTATIRAQESATGQIGEREGSAQSVLKS
jgi:uncharacterized protein YbjQ (UPF0145 family)